MGNKTMAKCLAGGARCLPSLMCLLGWLDMSWVDPLMAHRFARASCVLLFSLPDSPLGPVRRTCWEATCYRPPWGFGCTSYRYQWNSAGAGCGPVHCTHAGDWGLDPPLPPEPILKLILLFTTQSWPFHSAETVLPGACC